MTLPARKELGWDATEVREGRAPEAVASGRLDRDELARLRSTADQLDLSLPETVSRAVFSTLPPWSDGSSAR